jgi:hypothetical protein
VIADYQPQVTILLGDNVYADIIEGRLRPATPEHRTSAELDFSGASIRDDWSG